MAKRHYTGMLATPIPANLTGRARAQAEDARLDALLRFHGIARGPEMWADLTAVLMHEHVPGFRENVGSIAHVFRWDYRTLRVLYILIETQLLHMEIKGTRASVVEAVKLAAPSMNDIYARLRVGKRKMLSPNALRKAYYEARTRWGSGVEGILKAIHESTDPKGALEDFE